MAVALTAGVFINERKSGLLDRSLVAGTSLTKWIIIFGASVSDLFYLPGVQMTEVLFAHLVNQFTVLVGQTALVFICMLWIFSIPCEGNLFTAVIITLLQGLCGMSYGKIFNFLLKSCFVLFMYYLLTLGLLVSSLCDTEISAIHLSLGSFYPTLLLSGIIWPIEGMSSYLRYFSYCLPQTYAIESLRSIFGRGWGLDLPDVYRGILISLAWIFAILALSVVVVRVRKHTG